MRLAGIALVWVWCSLWACTVFAGDAALTASLPQPRQIGVLDGLPSNQVNAMAEDRQGYLWIATRDGLARYDGVGFRVWRVEDGLRDNFVWTVHVDAQDRVWIGTRRGGLSMLDADRATFTHYNHETHPEIRGEDIWAVISTPDGAVWFGTADTGLYRLDGDGTLRRFDAKPGVVGGLPSNSVGHFALSPDGVLWIGTKDGVVRWTGREFVAVPVPPEEPGRVNGLAMSGNGKLWIRLVHGGAVLHPDGHMEVLAQRDPVLDTPVLHMLVEDWQGARWFDTRSGLAREVDGRMEDVPLFSFASRGAVRPSWSSAYQDREGGLWFASSDAGLWYLPANWRNFTVMQRRLSDPASSGNAFVRGAAAASDGGFWLVGSGGVLDHLDPRTGRIQHRLSQVCGSGINRSVRETRFGHVWIGCIGQLVRFDPATGRVQRWMQEQDADPAPRGEIEFMAEQPDGLLWVGGDIGMQLRAPDGRIVDSIRFDSSLGLPASARPLQISNSPDGTGLWLATTSGLYQWVAQTRRFEPVPGGPVRPVHAVSRHRDGTIWLASTGILDAYRWTGSALDLLRRAGAEDGLPVATPGGMAVDARGIVWVTTVRGLIRFDPSTSRTRLFGMRDGLPSQEFSEQQIAVSNAGHFAVGTAEGLLLFHPGHVHRRAEMPPLVIEALALRRGDETVELPTDEPILLQHGDRDFRVGARLLSFTDAHTHHYRFRLEGYETEWVVADETAERVFPRLESGRYTLHVQARTEDGDWTALAPIEIHQAPPWWRTVWAILAMVLLVAMALGLAAGAYRERLRRKAGWQLAEHKRELAEHASQAKTRFLATLGHEVRTPMTGVLGMSELLLNTELGARQRGYAESIRRAGDHLMRLVNDALDLARIEAGRLELDPQPFEPVRLVQDVVALCAPMARDKSLQFDTAIDTGVPARVLGDAGRVRQILLNLLGNAVKFTERGHIGLRLGVSAEGALVFTVSDTGPGLSAEQRDRLFRRFEQAEGVRTASRYGGSGLGLAISQELSMAMGGRIDVESTPGAGTRFSVTLPLPASEGAAAPPVEAEYQRITAAVGLEVLLVEDDPTVAEVIAGLLHSQGHEVVHAMHGLAALSEISVRSFDLALLDLDLPGIDGLALAGMMRAHGFAQPLVAVTARADINAEAVARAAGFDGFLRKPLTGEMLADTLAGSWRPSREGGASPEF